MSILIKGMEMPKEGCKDCPFAKRGRIFDICPFLKREVNGNVERGGNLSDCPLIELPDHGRLVDADEVIAESRCGDYWWETEEEVPKILNEIPTIIPAEKKGGEDVRL